MSARLPASAPSPLDARLPRTGTAEDFMGGMILAEERRRERLGQRVPEKSPAARRLLEPPFNLVGGAVRAIIELLPSAWTLAIHDRVYRALAQGRCQPVDLKSKAMAGARALIDRVGAETGREPALLALLSHPPVVGEGSHLTFELVRHAMQSLFHLRRRSGRPRLVVAVDAFALDTVSLANEAMYAGCLGLYHIGLDRLYKSRSALSRMILSATDWSRMPWRLARSLSDGGEIGLVLAGGVPATTRVLYAAREWVGEARRAAGASRAGPARGAPNSKRALEGDLAAALLAPEAADGTVPADTGRLGDRGRRAVRRCADALGLAPGEAQRQAGLLEEEFARETPYRRRLFRFLARRVAGGGRPVVLLPIVHRLQPPGVEIAPASAWISCARGVLRALVPGPGGPAPWSGAPEEFAVRFVGANFQ